MGAVPATTQPNLPLAWSPALLTRRARILNTLRNRLALWRGRTNMTQEQALRVQYLQLIINSHSMALVAHNPRNSATMRLQALSRKQQWDAQVCALRPRIGMPSTPVCDRLARTAALTTPQTSSMYYT